MKIVGRRIEVSYFDHNDRFANYLPRTGSIIRELTDTCGSGPWYHMELDQPFDYQVSLDASCRFRLVNVAGFMVKSRWQGVALGEGETSVFILLVEASRPPPPGDFEQDSFVPIAWGMCKMVS